MVTKSAALNDSLLDVLERVQAASCLLGMGRVDFCQKAHLLGMSHDG